MRISCPPTVSPCFYGVDTPTRKELIAATHSVEEIREYLGADTLGYLSIEGMRSAVGDTQGQYCLACYTCEYPTAIQEPLIAIRNRRLKRMETPEPKTEELSVPEPAVESKPAKPQRQETVWDTLRSLLIVLVGVLCIRTFVAEATVIPTGSMESTILIGDHVFLNKLLYGPRVPYTSLRLPPLREIHRLDIVAFRYPRNPVRHVRQARDRRGRRRGEDRRQEGLSQRAAFVRALRAIPISHDAAFAR